MPSHVGATPSRPIDSSRAARGLRKRVGFALLGSTCVSLQKGASLATMGVTCAALMLGATAPEAPIAPSLEHPGGAGAPPTAGQLSGAEQPQDPPSKITLPNPPG